MTVSGIRNFGDQRQVFHTVLMHFMLLAGSPLSTGNDAKRQELLESALFKSDDFDRSPWRGLAPPQISESAAGVSGHTLLFAAVLHFKSWNRFVYMILVYMIICA